MNTKIVNFYKPWDKATRNQILVINCGSSSIKVSLFEYAHESINRLLDVNLKGINTEKTVLEVESFKGKEVFPSPTSLNIPEGLRLIFKTLADHFNFSFENLMGIGHRFVHGGNDHYSSVRIDFRILADLEKLLELAPLHNDSCLAGIKASLSLAGAVPQVAIFDTAFHQSMPAVAAFYAIPNDICSKYPIKRYGFHGISHAFLWETYKKSQAKNYQKSKIITLHLGSGCSATAISEGISMDTSMGFTPAEGLVMGTRAGDIDVAVMEFVCLHDQKTPREVMDILNFHSGLLGVSDISSSLETLLKTYQQDEKVKLAVDIFCYRIVKYLGAYIAVLGGVEAIIFSGGIGENSSMIREQVINKMDWYGVKLDKNENQALGRLNPGDLKKISAPDSQVNVYVIATDENLFIAKEVQKILP